jgi:uncharacterized RDD family membrane protein YckC
MTPRTPDLAVDSVTGVDVSLPVAGPGARAYAFLLDWHIRAILGIAWYVVAALIYNGRLSLSAPLNPAAGWFAFVVTPAAAIYFLYHYVLEIAMHGRTPGKRMAGVHIVARDGGTPTVGSLLTRNVFRLVDSLPLFYGVGLVATMLTRDHVRVGDMAAGTLLVYSRTATALFEHVNVASLGQGLDAASAEIVNDLLQRWSTLDVAARRRLTREVLSRYGHLPMESKERVQLNDTSTDTGTQPSSTRSADDDTPLRMQLERLARGKVP